MRHYLVHRSSAFCLLIGGLLLCSGPAQAQLPDRTHASELSSARAAVRRLVLLGERAEARAGGEIALARGRAETASARNTAAWLDWLPDFSSAVRRQIEQDTDTEFSVPRWRLDFEGQVALSLPKLYAGNAAQAARAKALAEFEQTAHLARLGALQAGFELYFVERHADLLQHQLATFESIASAMTQAAREGTNDGLLLQGYVGELRGKLAEVEFQQRVAAQHLAATFEAQFETSGIDARLDLPQLLQLIRTEASRSSAHDAQIRGADTELEEERMRWAESQAWYVPELRSTTLALVPQGNAGDPGSSSFRLSSITTEVALGLRLRPAVPALQAAQRAAIAKSRFAAEQSRGERAQLEDQARARLEDMSRAWLDDSRIRSSSAELDDTLQRFARGERSVEELAAAGRSVLRAQLARELLLTEAVVAQLELSSNDRSDLPTSNVAAREELRAPDLDQRMLRSVERAPLLKSARAEAERASEQARSERFPLATALEAGVLFPVYEQDARLPVRSELTLSGSGSLATVVREASLLGRWSLDLRATGPRERAAESEARLRQAQADLSRKKHQWSLLEARLELAHARRSVRLSQRVSQAALESLQSEQRWFEQGASSERDLRAAELSHQVAQAELAIAASRQRSAELRLSGYLGAERGEQYTVNETPEALEGWARQRFLPENGLLGFEAFDRQREAMLEAALARAQSQSLANPAQSTTFTAQAVQGLRGGAFSLTFALSVALDPPRDALQITRAAEREGAAQGRSTALERELDEQRARVEQRLEQAKAVLENEGSIRERLEILSAALRRKQAAMPDVHQAVKQRQLAGLQTALFESEKRELEADEQRRAASLRSLALGASPSAPRGLAGANPSLTVSEDALIRRAPEVAIADAAAERAKSRQPVPLASAFHLVGPFVVGSYAANRVVGPSTTKAWRGDLGVGLALGLDESLSFIGSNALSHATELERRAARESAALRAIHELGRTWTARQLARVSLEEEAEAHHQLEDSVQPRFELGQVTAATVLEAQRWHALARLRRTSDQSLLRTQHALLAALGGPISDTALDEYQRRAATLSLAQAAARAPRVDRRSNTAELAAQSRNSAASSAATASALRVVSPITALVEARPALLETTTGTDETMERSTGHELLWVFSLIVPLKPKEIGSLSVASAQARESEEELGAAERSARLRWQALRTRHFALREEQASAAARTVAAERALAELDRRLHAAREHATIDDLAPARQALFEARRAEVVSTGAVLETALMLEALKGKP
ncbi:MAG TPA: TolC family protein [Polyangiaceae bacterium]|nr:TolC family protein [Polyangiaceae bacterium]